MKKSTIIVAGGSGKRMETSTPKQFLNIAKKPILIHTIEAFLAHSQEMEIILVLPEEQLSHWEKICQKHSFTHELIIAHGGQSRFHSVKNGLQFVDNDSLVAVHDGVRPLVAQSTIGQSFELAEKHGAAVPCLSLSDSVRLIEDEGSRTFDRHLIKRVQTPQCFRSSILKRAYNQEFIPSFTDDASVAESIGQQITLFDGNRENIKITRPFDLVIADCYLRKRHYGLIR